MRSYAIHTGAQTINNNVQRDPEHSQDTYNTDYSILFLIVPLFSLNVNFYIITRAAKYIADRFSFLFNSL